MISRLSSVIVNADDLGKNEGTNQAIREAFARGAVSSATIMSNMPGFDEACELVKRHGWHHRIGVHLNISEGRALTKPITSISSLCDEKGNFHFRTKLFSLVFAPSQARALYVEMKAQIERVIKAGICPTHLDSHHHVHTIWAVATQVIALAKEYNILAVRLTANITPPRSRLKRIYKPLFNSRLHHHGLAKTSWFGRLEDVEAHFARLNGSLEIMVHPVFNDEGQLINLSDEDRRLLIPTVSELNIGDRMCPYS